MTIVMLAGESLDLLAERALWWAREKTLFIADAHFGKAAAFAAFGVPVPPASDRATVARLAGLTRRLGARHVVFLGDFIHHRTAWSDATLAPLIAWRAEDPSIALTLVRGNHDLHGGDPPENLSIRCLDAPHPLHPFTLLHEPAQGGSESGFHFAGHLHPAVVLHGRRSERARLPCFWIRGNQMVLPAFGEFTGSMKIEQGPEDRVYAVVQDTVIPIPRPRFP